MVCFKSAFCWIQSTPRHNRYVLIALVEPCGKDLLVPDQISGRRSCDAPPAATRSEHSQISRQKETFPSESSSITQVFSLGSYNALPDHDHTRCARDGG